MRNALGDALARAGDARGLVDQALAWLPYDPGNPTVYEHLATGFAGLSDRTEAVRALTSLVDAAPGDDGLVNRAGFLAFRMDDLPLSERLFRLAVEQRPDHVNNHRGLALTLWIPGRHRDGAEVLRHAQQYTYEARYHDVRRILREELGLLLASWLQVDPHAPVETFGHPPAPTDALRVTLHWETDATDVDLHIVDPAGEECFYGHKQNASGLALYEDLTQGLGPECAVVPAGRMQSGSYRIGVHYFSSGPMGVSRGIVLIQRPGLGGKPDVRVETFALPDEFGAPHERHVRPVATVLYTAPRAAPETR